jgi:hypothetical protein
VSTAGSTSLVPHGPASPCPALAACRGLLRRSGPGAARLRRRSARAFPVSSSCCARFPCEIGPAGRYLSAGTPPTRVSPVASRARLISSTKRRCSRYSPRRSKLAPSPLPINCSGGGCQLRNTIGAGPVWVKHRCAMPAPLSGFQLADYNRLLTSETGQGDLRCPPTNNARIVIDW